jgi:hypothetical protein
LLVSTLAGCNHAAVSNDDCSSILQDVSLAISNPDNQRCATDGDCALVPQLGCGMALPCNVFLNQQGAQNAQPLLDRWHQMGCDANAICQNCPIEVSAPACNSQICGAKGQ